MKLYEYQAKQIFQQHAIPKPDGDVALDLKQLPKAIRACGKAPWVLKAQVLAGGRGKAGGVKILKTLPQAKAFAKSLLGKNLVTHQTGAKGEKVVGVLVEKPAPNIAQEMYVSILLDRKLGLPMLLASAEGGMDIETLAKTKPEAILRVPIDPQQRLPAHKARLIAKQLGLTGKSIIKTASILSRLCDVFFKADANLVEVNPLAITEDGDAIALDGKITTDDNALFRHSDQQAWKKALPQPAAEKKAAKANLSYIQLDGSVGCLVNGAGLAMATMDIIKQHGGEPANFLDVGGGANAQQVSEAFKIILSDKRVKGILVNIFGGIMRCDVIAEGIVAAAKKTKIKVPLVVRLEGTKSPEGKEILAKSKLKITPADSLTDAAEKIVKAVKGKA